ncbi:myozenin-3 [Tiliqua scincoides]|uniref:myozenin-3 n=1 Tax=Tiliqua scincoides TaxID=71010 RepID=UPI0034631F6D
MADSSSSHVGKMFPLPSYEPFKEKRAQAQVFVRKLNGGDIVQLDLGKKVSVPQDLMMEELSLPINKGSVLYQKRQKRVQNFVLEHPEGYKTTINWTAGTAVGSDATHDALGATERQMAVHNAEGKENYPAELHMAASGKGAPPKVPKKTNKVLQMSRALNPNAIAPGYSGPLKGVPPEKFNSTAIPKGYQCPWQEFLNSEDYQLDTGNRLPEPPKKVKTLDLRSFNRTPTPFGGLLLNDAFEAAEGQTDTITSLELMLNRPSFNRAPQGWIYVMPESEEL